jgi:hypothetical protein
MNPRHLVIAVALPAVALAVGVLAAVPGQQHHQQPSYGRRADAGPLLLQPALQHRGGSRPHRPHRASHQSKHSKNDSTKNGTNQAITLSTFANVDYASGGYGQYNSAALHSSWVQAVDINLNWRRVQTSPSSFDWAPLDREATAWASAGKHIVLVVRATDDKGGGCSAGPGQYLPGWEITALHNALGGIGTFCDKGFDSLVPDWFSSTFQSDFKTFVTALGAHVSAQPYYSSISYVRVGVGLGSEGWYLYPNQNGYSADKSWMETNWHYTPQAWENFQETMLAAYHAAFPPPVQVIYPISAQDDLSPGNPVDLAVAEWATNLGGVGVGEQCLAPGGIGNYADFATIDSWVRANHPNAYIQFQTCGPTATASEEQGIINAAEGYGAKSIEWYETTIVSPPSVSEMTSYQTWANNTFRG